MHWGGLICPNKYTFQSEASHLQTPPPSNQIRLKNINKSQILKTLTYDEWIIFIRSNSDISSWFIIHHLHFLPGLQILIHPPLFLILHPYSWDLLSLLLLLIHPYSCYLFILTPATYSSSLLILIHPYNWYLIILTPATYSSLLLLLIHPYSWYLSILTTDT